MTQCIDLISIGLLILSKPTFPAWLLVARCGAVMILTNITYILLPHTNVSHSIPDRILVFVFPSEYSALYHIVFGTRVLIAGLIHTIAHILHIRYAIALCVNGCSRSSIYVVPPSTSTVKISYKYFFSLYAYVTGFVLVGIFGLLILWLLLNGFRLLRFSTNQMLHKYCAILGIALTIAHSGSKLIGFNFSYVLTLPFLIFYLWFHRYELLVQIVRITRWVVTPSLIRLYLEDNDYFDKMLNSFGTVTILVNNPKISYLEWHPFTLARGGKEAILSIQRLGLWTSRFGNLLQTQVQASHFIRLGHYKLSKFRFHHLYNVRYFFCAGIGITAFISAMADTRKRIRKKYTSVLIWSVSSMDIVQEFIRHLNDLSNQMPRIKIEIYYSNSSKGIVYVSEQTRTRFVYLQSIIHGYNSIDIAFGAPSCAYCAFARVDFMQVLSRAILALKNSANKDIGVFICGSNRCVSNATKYVNLANANNYDITFHVWSEST